MKIMPMGLDYRTSQPLSQPMEEGEFAARVGGALDDNSAVLRRLDATTSRQRSFRSELQRERTPDLGDPKAAGWSFLVAADDPERDAKVEAIRPLAEHRGMSTPIEPLVFQREIDVYDWIINHYTSMPVRTRPFYILILGSPEQVPFHLQTLLAVGASVGRLDFDNITDLQTYAKKVVSLELADDPATDAHAIFFGTDHGVDDPTYFSCRFMVEPMIELVKADGTFTTKALLRNQATKSNLLSALRGSSPAFVYTASHGIADPDGPFENQQRVNGAICCEQTGDETYAEEWLLLGEDVPTDEPFLEGSVFFQFACYGYGTPAQSDFAHWDLGSPEMNTERDFVAALPKALVAHPRGPIGFIGHVDTAWLHGFDDPDQPFVKERWHPRLRPFITAMEYLLHLQPTGYALGDLGQRFDETNAVLTNLWDRARMGHQFTERDERDLSEMFIFRSDARNYMVFGDPAARLRVGKPD
jgi:hypothetical protein